MQRSQLALRLPNLLLFAIDFSLPAASTASTGYAAAFLDPKHDDRFGSVKLPMLRLGVSIAVEFIIEWRASEILTGRDRAKQAFP
jgi:hypothetical protein